MLGLALIAPTVTHAGYIQCKSHTIARADADKALSEARRALGASKILRSSLWACMNPGTGRVRLDAEPEPQSDGSTLHRRVTCRRARTPWTCEVGVERRATVDVPMANARQTLQFSLPLDLDLADARQFVRRAMDIGPTLQPLQECYAVSAPEADITTTRLTDTREAFTVTAESSWARVERMPDGAIAVSVSVYTIYFSPPLDDPDWHFRCWDVQIVVT